MKISVAKRTAALLGSVVFVLAAINSVNDQAVADSIPIENWEMDTRFVPIDTGGNVNLTIDDHAISDTRYVVMDKVTFNGKRHQTIDTGIIVRDNLPAVDNAGFHVEATAAQIGSGYLFSTSGVYPGPTSSIEVLFPRWGLFYGMSPFSWTPRDEHLNGTRTAFSTGIGSEFPSNVTQHNLVVNLTGFISASISNPTGISFNEQRSVTPPGASTNTDETNNIGFNTSVLGDGTLLIGGLGGNCLVSTVPANCQYYWDQDAGFRTSTVLNTYHRSTMFQGDITSFKAFGNPGTTSDTNNVLLFDGIPAYDQVTGFCGFYDLVSSTFKTAEPGYEALLQCSKPSITVESTSDADDPKMVFANNDPGQCSAPVTNPCMENSTTNGILVVRLALPALPNGWAPGSHPFRLTISMGAVKRTIDFTLDYVGGTPPGTLSIDKRAWEGVPVGTQHDAILNGAFTKLLDGAVLPLDTDITFTFTVLYEVPADEGVNYTGRPGLTNVVITDKVGDTEILICVIDTVLVNTPVGCTAPLVVDG